MPCHRSPWVLWVMGFAQSVGQQRGLSVVRKGDECSGTALHFLAAEGHAQAVEMGSPINDRSGNMYLQDSNTSLSKLSKSYSFRVEGSILISDQWFWGSSREVVQNLRFVKHSVQLCCSACEEEILWTRHAVHFFRGRTLRKFLQGGGAGAWKVKGFWTQTCFFGVRYSSKTYWHSEEIRSDPWNIPQTLNHRSMKEILSYLCFGAPGVCSRGLLKFS